MKYACSDESGVVVEIEADSAQEAAEEYVSSGDWEDGRTRSVHHLITVRNADGDFDVVSVSVHPKPPPCPGGDEHSWKETAVWGSTQGGVYVESSCRNCSVTEHHDSGASHPVNGTRVTNIRYQGDEE